MAMTPDYDSLNDETAVDELLDEGQVKVIAQNVSSKLLTGKSWNDRVYVTLPIPEGELPIEDLEKLLIKFAEKPMNSGSCYTNPDELAVIVPLTYWYSQDGKPSSVKHLSVSQWVCSSTNEVLFDIYYLKSPIKLSYEDRTRGQFWIPQIMQFLLKPEGGVKFFVGDRDFTLPDGGLLTELYSDESQVLHSYAYEVKEDGLRCEWRVITHKNSPKIRLQFVMGLTALAVPNAVYSLPRLRATIGGITTEPKAPQYPLVDGSELSFEYEIELDENVKIKDQTAEPECKAIMAPASLWLKNPKSFAGFRLTDWIDAPPSLTTDDFIQTDEIMAQRYRDAKNKKPDEYKRGLIRSSAGGDQLEFNCNLTDEAAWTILGQSDNALKFLRESVKNASLRPNHLYDQQNKIMIRDNLFKYESRVHYDSSWVVGFWGSENLEERDLCVARTKQGPGNGGFRPPNHVSMQPMKTSHFYVDNLVWSYVLTNDLFQKVELEHHAADVFCSYLNEATKDFHFTERQVRSITGALMLMQVFEGSELGNKLRQGTINKVTRLSKYVKSFSNTFLNWSTKGSTGPYGCPVTYCNSETRGKIIESWMFGFTYQMFKMLIETGTFQQEWKFWLDHYMERIGAHFAEDGEGYDFVNMETGEWLQKNNYGQYFWKNPELVKLVAYLKQEGYWNNAWDAQSKLVEGPIKITYKRALENKGSDVELPFPHPEALRHWI